MRIAGIATITAAVLAAASLLWQTEVPDDLVLRARGVAELPGAARADEYGDGLRLLWLGGTAAQLLLAGVLAWRWRPSHAAAVLAIVLVGLWLERYILVYPSLYSSSPDIPFSWIELAPMLFFVGLLALAVTGFQARFPIFQIWQPASELELLGVEPIDSQVTAPMDDEIL